jgi:hypothetical protein
MLLLSFSTLHLLLQTEITLHQLLMQNLNKFQYFKMTFKSFFTTLLLQPLNQESERKFFQPFVFYLLFVTYLTA